MAKLTDLEVAMINLVLFVIVMVEAAKSRRAFWKWYREYCEREDERREDG